MEASDYVFRRLYSLLLRCRYTAPSFPFCYHKEKNGCRTNLGIPSSSVHSLWLHCLEKYILRTFEQYPYHRLAFLSNQIQPEQPDNTNARMCWYYHCIRNCTPGHASEF